MWLDSSQQVAKLDITHVCILSSCLRVQDTARYLGVVIDSQLSLSAHVTAVCQSGYLLPVVPTAAGCLVIVGLMSEDVSKTLVQVFVAWTTATLLFGISEGLMNWL